MILRREAKHVNHGKQGSIFKVQEVGPTTLGPFPSKHRLEMENHYVNCKWVFDVEKTHRLVDIPKKGTVMSRADQSQNGRFEKILR